MSRHSGGTRSSGARPALVLGLSALVVAGSWALPIGTAAANAAAARPAPKVVLIVGPAGAATPSYRRLADEAAVAAAKLTTNVVKVYSPDATWPNVKAALQGASVVVYLGHGNGFPSIYHDELFPTTEDGFGLNPDAGAADSHQYFGETQIGTEVKLARDAVVIFSHLCYASGNAEPGLAEGTLAQAQQRVDNYAAGFFQAGAGAVIADAYLAPEYYVRSVLRGNRSIDAIWRNAPNRNDHFLQFASRRTKGAIAQMDPDNVDSGFHRSIVLQANLSSGDVVGHAVGGPGIPLPVPDPTLIDLGVTFGAPDLTAPPTAGSKTTLTLPVASDAAALLPAKLMVGTRWDRLDGAAATSAPPAVAPAPTGDADPGTTAADDAAAGLVVPEVPGEVVAPVRARRLRGGGVAVPVTIPSTPGLYRLVATIHQPDGVAYDAATQALIPALLVRVTGPVNVTYAVPATATAGVGAAFDLTVRVTNLGRTAWGHPADPLSIAATERQRASRAMLVVRWVDLGGLSVAPAGLPGGVANSVLPAGLAPGASVTVDVPLLAPAGPGEYLLVLDVVDPATGSLAAAGVPPGIIRVTVSR